MWRVIFHTSLLVFLAVLIGTGLDFLAHQTGAEYAVPSYYFQDKIIFGTFWGIMINWFVSRKMESRLPGALSFGALLSTLLQVRYFLEGYPLSFVFTFLGIHFIAFSLPAYFLLYRGEQTY